MKKLLLIFMFTGSVFYLYAGSHQSQEYTEVKLEITNMLNENATIYFNDLLKPYILKPEEKREFLRTPMHTIEHPGYFAIEYSSGKFELYTFIAWAPGGVGERSPQKDDLSYTVMINEDGVKVSPGEVSGIYNYHKPDWVFQRVGVLYEEGFSWEKSTWNSIQSWFDTGIPIEFVLINNTDIRMSFEISTFFYGEDRGRTYFYRLNTRNSNFNPGSITIRTTNKMIELDKKLTIMCSYNSNDKFNYYQIYFDFNSNFLLRMLTSPAKVQITFNEKGYEVLVLDND